MLKLLSGHSPVGKEMMQMALYLPRMHHSEADTSEEQQQGW